MKPSKPKNSILDNIASKTGLVIDDVIRVLMRNKAKMIEGGAHSLTKESLELDIEKGDILLGGRFKNQRMEVKKIGTDELGQPTINGKKLLSFRIEKKLPIAKQSRKTQEMNKTAADIWNNINKLKAMGHTTASAGSVMGTRSVAAKAARKAAKAASMKRFMENLKGNLKSRKGRQYLGETNPNASTDAIAKLRKTSALIKEARKGRTRFEAMLATGDLPDDSNPNLGCPRADQFESAIQKAWLKGVDRLQKSDTPTINKIAAPAYMNLFRKGKLSNFDIATITKKLKLKPRTIKFLGGGAEGATHLVTHPETGLAAMKTYNPKSLYYHPEYIQSKTRALKKMNPKLVAPFIGVHPSRPAVYSEYVPKASKTVNKWSKTAPLPTAPSKTPSWANKAIGGVPEPTVIKELPKDLASKGLRYKITDLHSDNIINNKIIDFLLINKKFGKTRAGQYQKMGDVIFKKLKKGELTEERALSTLKWLKNRFGTAMEGKNVTKSNVNDVMRDAGNFKWHGV